MQRSEILPVSMTRIFPTSTAVWSMMPTGWSPVACSTSCWRCRWMFRHVLRSWARCGRWRCRSNFRSGRRRGGVAFALAEDAVDRASGGTSMSMIASTWASFKCEPHCGRGRCPLHLFDRLYSSIAFMNFAINGTGRMRLRFTKSCAGLQFSGSQVAHRMSRGSWNTVLA